MNNISDTTFFIIVAGIFILAFGVWFLWQVRHSPNGERLHVTNILRQFSSIRSFKVMRDITLTDGARSVHVDNILVGFFGLLFLNVQVEKADYYGDEKGETWSFMKKDIKTRFPNPLLQGETAMEIVRSGFAKKNIYRVPMEQVVVFSTSFRKTGLYVKDTLPIVNVRKLHAFLDKTRFGKDNNMDVEQLVETLNSMRG